ncbi:MAG: LytR family transcriptional regulator [Clostridiales bacterium]|nr:LytR family transcriptional regulator [Clostridiales bacterium]
MKRIMHHHKRGRRWTGCLLAVLLCTLLLGAVSPVALAEQAETFNLLLIGEDAAGNSENGRSDAMLLAQITPSSGDVKLVSFLRDLYVPVEGHGKTRLNAAYFYGGEELLKKTLSACFDVCIDRTLAVDFATMVNLIDQIGGVEIELTPQERMELNSILATYCRDEGIAVDGQLVSEGNPIVLNGLQALSFSRIRQLDSDFGRVGRQQQVLVGLLKRLTTLDAFTLMRLAIQNIQHVRTDMSLGDLFDLLPILSREGGLHLRSARVPFDDTCRDVQVNGMWVLDCDMATNTRLLHEFLDAP